MEEITNTLKVETQFIVFMLMFTILSFSIRVGPLSVLMF